MGTHSSKKSHSKLSNVPQSSTTKNHVTSKDKAILDLKNARDRLKKYQNRLEVEKETLHYNAKKLLQKGHKDRALLALKMKKVKQVQIEKAGGYLLNVLEMVDAVEWETQQLRVFEGLKAGNTVLDIIHKEMSMNAVEKLMEETAEAQETANQISQLISGTLTHEDEESVLEELARIEEMEADSLALELPQVPQALPDVIQVEQDKETKVTVKMKSEKEKKATLVLA